MTRNRLGLGMSGIAATITLSILGALGGYTATSPQALAQAAPARKAAGAPHSAARTTLCLAILSLCGGNPRRDCKASGTGEQNVNTGSLWAGGTYTPTSTPGGVYANIYNYSPWVVPGSDVSAWTMLADGNAKNGDVYAQIGWAEQAYGNRETFVEWSPDSSTGGTWVDHYDTAAAVGSWKYYVTLFNPSGVAGGTFSFGGEPWTWAASWSPNTVEVSGEVHNNADQMPGGFNTLEQYEDIEVWAPAGSGGSWQTTQMTQYSSNPDRYIVGTAIGRIDTYDNDCN